MSETAAQSAICVADVLENARICDEHYRVVLSLRDMPPTAPGQFMQILCEQPSREMSFASASIPHQPTLSDDGWPTLTQPELTEARALLRRPLSIAARRNSPDGVELDFIYRAVGVGTAWLSSVRAGQKIDVLGPLGNRFGIDSDRPLAAMIGGGVGIPPMIYLAQSLSKAGKQAVAFSGARTAGLLPLTLLDGAEISSTGHPTQCTAEFAAHSFETSIATDDGSLGYSGLVTEPFERWLDELDSPADDLTVYTCGPEAMMRAVARICVSRGITCQVSLERHMACGMGTCQSCVCKVHQAGGWAFKLCCTDGPVFNARDVIWD